MKAVNKSVSGKGQPPQPIRHGSMGQAIFASALEALQANRLRSFLTMLGVIIGVSAVISVVTLTQGVNQSVSNRLSSLGTNVLTISPGATTTTGARNAAGTSQTLTIEDVQALMQVNHVLNVSPILNTSGQVIFEGQNWNTRVQGVYPDYQTIQNWQLADGSWFSDEAEQMGNPVAVLGQTVAQNLFQASATSPVGQTIRINDQLFRVVGVLQAKGTQGASNADDVIFVPFNTARERLKPSLYVDQIQLQIDTVNDIAQAQQDITSLLRTRHHLRGPDPSQTPTANRSGNTGNLGGAFGGGGGSGARNGGNFGGGGARGGGGFAPGTGAGSGSRSGGTGLTRTNIADPNDFQVFNVNQLVQTAQQNSSELTILLVGIAAISLTIGGIGIMNIMLVSVTERTREIGIRMAIGARRRDIRNQFLVEALLLSVLGGLVGILLGLLGGFILTVSLGFPFTISVIAMSLAFGISATVGIIFGLYPAVRASRLDPIVALRTE